MSAIKSICRAMERIAPLRLAEKWDNVGLLLEAPGARPNATRILLTIDLTAAVADEAIAGNACCIVSYHPAIFKPLSALTLADPKQASLLRCAAHSISVYSPHTALDAVATGINTWLARAFYDDEQAFARGVSWIGEPIEDGLGGQGRVATLSKPLTMKELEARIKAHLKLEHIQVAYVAGHNAGVDTVSSVAICAGSGGSMLLGHPADLYLTGEMSHHEVLAAIGSGHNVVLCGHTNTERGYLPTLAKRLLEELTVEAGTESDPAHTAFLRALQVDISTKDKHPLLIV